MRHSKAASPNFNRRCQGRIMVINNVDRAEFIHLLPSQSDLESFVGKEVEWFSNTAGNVIGTIALGDRNRGWKYAILRRETMGKFHLCNVARDFYSQVAARIHCVFAMAAAGEIVFWRRSARFG
jgi:hypothetical protein